MAHPPRWLAALIGAALALPSFSTLASPAGESGNAAAAARASAIEEMAGAGGILESWSDYALSNLKANFAWAREPGETAVAPPTVFTRPRSSWARTPASRFPGAAVDDSRPFQVAVQSARVSESAIYAAATDAGSLVSDRMPGLRRTIVAPSFTHSLDAYGYWRVSLILAYQKFDLFAPMQGADSASGWAGADNPAMLRYKENSVGFGTRLDVGGKLVAGLDWRAGYQSRVAMDNFYTFRGIFGQAGSFDIPASASFGLDWTPLRDLTLSADAERVMYSQIAPFASYSLPVDFQYFIQATGRPLAWENLDIRSLAAAWRNRTLGEFSIRYSTREQPLPTLRVLQQLLDPHLASHDWEFDYTRALGERALFRLRALYAPIQLLGIPSYTADGNYGANRMRYEALLTTTF